MSNTKDKSYSHKQRFKVGGRLVAPVAVLLLSTSLWGCSHSKKASNNVNTSATSPGVALNSTPPYTTKEPQTYQAKYVTSVQLGGNSSPLASVIGAMKKEIFVARDGDQRRQDFEVVPGVKISYVENSDGRFVLLPGKKIYASLDAAAKSPPSDSSSPFSLDRLITQQHDGSNFEKLGTESINGKAATKYRVTPVSAQNEQGATVTETIVWVDQSLGMPIKSVTTSKTKTGEQTVYTMSVEDIQDKSDPSLFQIPDDFKRVDYSDIRAQMYGGAPAVQSPSGKPVDPKVK